MNTLILIASLGALCSIVGAIVIQARNDKKEREWSDFVHDTQRKLDIEHHARLGWDSTTSR